jgi:hypothetical protein
MTAGTTPTTTSNLPVIATGIPLIGTIDFNSPTEWIFWGGLAVDILFVEGLSKWLIAAGIIAARYELGKESAA